MSNKKTKNVNKFTDKDIEEAVAMINVKNDIVANTVLKKKGLKKTQMKEAEENKRIENDGDVAAAQQHMPVTDAQLYLEHHMRQKVKASYVNVPKKWGADKLKWQRTETGKYIRMEQFDRDTEKLELVKNLFNKELTEPYVDFTYEYFIMGWTDLCLLAYTAEGDDEPVADVKGTFVGAIVSNVTCKKFPSLLTGYVAMLAVIPEHRNHKIASILIRETIELMRDKGCDEVVLETPIDNVASINLYTGLGFAKTKFMRRYYIQGQDAVRLKLWLKPSNRSLIFSQQKHEPDEAAVAVTTAVPIVHKTAVSL